MKISATIITLNEEANISDCLKSLEFVDEIVVLDSGSTDRTEEIVRSYPGVKFVHQDWLGYGLQKNKAAECAQHDWILNIDADERVSPQLRSSIVAADANKNLAYRMPRENYFGGRWIKHCGWYPDYTTRLYNRTTCRFSERSVHEALEHEGPVGTLSGNLRHYTYSGIDDYISRMNRYSSLAASEMSSSGRTASIYSLLLSPLATFIKMYILRLGFLEGRAGLVLSLLYAQYTFNKYAKLSEISHKV